jgi:hypothetical protein
MYRDRQLIECKVVLGYTNLQQTLLIAIDRQGRTPSICRGPVPTSGPLT